MPYEENMLDDSCDLDPEKTCDNCCKCIEVDKDYIEIPVFFEGMEDDENENTRPFARSVPRPKRRTKNR